MEKDLAVNRVLRDLKLKGLINEINKFTGDVVKIYLNTLWVAGWEQARIEFAARTNKAVIQYDASEHKMENFESIEKAAKRMKCSRETIARAIRTGRKTVRGHIWKFADNGDDKHQQK